MELRELQESLQYKFGDETLLETALTHPSYGTDYGTPHYQRLEFLGDAVLELAVSRYLFDHRPEEAEGRLTRVRAALVCEESLCEAARAYDLGKRIRLATGEEKTGGREKPSILADVMEAVFGAVYLDGGVDSAFALVYRTLGERLAKNEDILRVDSKTHLQEVVQRTGGQAPTYEMVSMDGPPHLPSYVMRVLVAGQEAGRGAGRSKRAAEQEAARTALKKLISEGESM